MGWKNGDISLGGGWFALLYSGDEKSAIYHNMMIIGHIADENLDKVKTMQKRVSLTITVAE